MKRQISFYHQHQGGLEIIHAANSRISYPLHNHVGTCVIGFLLKGEIILTRGNQKRLVKPGALFILPPYEPNAITAGSEPYDLLSICLHQSKLESSRMPTLSKAVRHYLTGILPPGTLKAPDYQALQNAIKAAMQYCTGNPPHRQNQRLASLLSRLAAGAESKVSVKQMAETVFASKYHFIRQFRKYTGLTPHRFRLQNRVRKAQKMLPQAASLADVALMAGFYDQSHLIRHFRIMLGMTPREYIRACQALPE